MDEFDFDLNNMDEHNIGNRVDKLKCENNKDQEIELDYNIILSDINELQPNPKKSQTRELTRKEKKNINMNSFVRNLETNLENLSKNDINNNKNIDSIKINKEKDKTYLSIIMEYKYLDIIFSILLFLLLNNKLTIETIYKLPYMNLDNPLPNLIIRAIIFGILIFIIKNQF
jgi:hypothetical protein